MATYDLVFAGGGAKGIVHCGAVQALVKQGHAVGRLAGTSAGAITAMLMAAGYDADGVAAIFSEKLADGRNRLTTLLDTADSFDAEAIRSSITYAELSFPFLSDNLADKVRAKILNSLLSQKTYRQLFSFVEFGGLYSGTAFLEWMQEKLVQANGRFAPTINLSDFYKQTGVHLTVIATDLVRHDRLILNHLTAPDLPVAWAVRMSMSIPLVWEEVVWQPEWGLYRQQDISGHAIVDGGVVANLPIDLMLDTSPEVIAAMGAPSSNQAIGLWIDDTLPVAGADAVPPSKLPLKERIQTSGRFAIVNQRFENLINTLTNAHDEIVLHTYPDHICRLPAKGFDTMEFDMSAARIALLIQAGAEAMRTYLKQE